MFNKKIMKVNELRIGNLLNYQISKIILQGKVTCLTNWKVTMADQYAFKAKDDENLLPIPLTEEWLVEFGFVKFKGNNILWGLGDFCIGWYGNKFATWIIHLVQENNRMDFHSQIEYVHQLQNLYWCLCGEELQINK